MHCTFVLPGLSIVSWSVQNDRAFLTVLMTNAAVSCISLKRSTIVQSTHVAGAAPLPPLVGIGVGPPVPSSCPLLGGMAHLQVAESHACTRNAGICSFLLAPEGSKQGRDLDWPRSNFGSVAPRIGCFPCGHTAILRCSLRDRLGCACISVAGCSV